MLYLKKEKKDIFVKTLIISDLDGTLLTARETVSEYSLNNLNRLIDECGLLFTYATARSLNSAAKACWGLRQNLPVILYNGAVIMEPWSGKLLYNNHFNRGQLRFIRETLAKFDILPLVYSFSKDGTEHLSWIEGRETSGMLRYLERRRGDKRLNPVVGPDSLVGDDIFYFNCIGKKEDLDALHECIEESLDIRCIYEQETYHTDYWCEIMPINTSKGTAALELKQILSADKIVSFGDGNNDIDLFSASDECYAVKNAAEKLKEKATQVIGYSEEDAVCKFLQANYEKYI